MQCDLTVTSRGEGGGAGEVECGCEGGGRAGQQEDWQLFVSRPGTLVWRRHHPDHNSLYEYRCWGEFRYQANPLQQLHL